MPGGEGGMSAEELTVVDVYDLAAAIGKECELIIATHGAEAVTGLLPRVVGALELLESLAARAERDQATMQELYDRVAHLENDKLEKQEYRQRFEKELEIIEEQWRSESAELVSAISRLQEENRRLQKEREGTESNTDTSNGSVMTNSGEQLWRRMGETNEQQRASLREKDVLLEDKETIIEGLTDQVKRLAASNREARRKQKYLMQQMRLLCSQRAELEAGVQARQREVASLRDALTNDQNGSGNGAQLAELIRERDQLKEQLDALQRTLNPETEEPPSLEIPNDDAGGSNFDEDDEPPVQGPLPYEPDDAPWKRQQSGIRKLNSMCEGRLERKITRAPEAEDLKLVEIYGSDVMIDNASQSVLGCSEKADTYDEAKSGRNKLFWTLSCGEMRCGCVIASQNPKRVNGGDL